MSGVENDVLGGGPSLAVSRGECAAGIEKRHLVMARVIRERAQAAGVDFIDVGTDHHYPFYGHYPPTRAGLDALGTDADDLLHYPSSYGLPELRQEFVRFARGQFAIELDEDRHVMVTTGASQAFDALSRALAGTYVIVPDLSLPTVAAVATGNGALIERVPLDPARGLMDLGALDTLLGAIARRGETVRFIYLNSPSNPTGAAADRDYLDELLAVAAHRRALVVHDMDVWDTSHTAERLSNILELPGAGRSSVTIVSLSKEFGLSGARIGFVAGNPLIVDAIRAHNSLFCTMLPEVCQRVALAALRSFNASDDRTQISGRITRLLEMSFAGWRRLGWPDEALLRPAAGFKYLFKPPVRFATSVDDFSGVELFDYFAASRAYVKFSTSRSFNPTDSRYMRMVLMQDERGTAELFRRLEACGVTYDMHLPASLVDECRRFLAELGDGDH